jgi:TPR repeat protein
MLKSLFSFVIVLTSLSCSSDKKKENKTENKKEAIVKSNSIIPTKPIKPKLITTSEKVVTASLPDHLKKLDKECNQGNPGPCRVLSTFFLKGISVKKNRLKAKFYTSLAKKYYIKIIPGWEKACTNKDAIKCINAAMAHRDGLGGTKDQKKAVGFFHKALEISKAGCKKNSGESCYQIGRIYHMGLLRMPGLSKRIKFKKIAKKQILLNYKKACKLKIADGCGALGRLSKDGKLVKPNPKKAKMWFTKGCNLIPQKERQKSALCKIAKLKKPLKKRK